MKFEHNFCTFEQGVEFQRLELFQNSCFAFYEGPYNEPVILQRSDKIVWKLLAPAASVAELGVYIRSLGADCTGEMSEGEARAQSILETRRLLGASETNQNQISEPEAPLVCGKEDF